MSAGGSGDEATPERPGTSSAALVTGGGSGLGRATAVAFAEHGISVLVADIDDVMGAETVELVRNAGGEGLYLATDVTSPAEVTAMVAACVAAFGSLDYAVNNAGTTGAPGFTADYDVDDWHRTITLNLDSVFYCLKAEIPVMLAHGGGAIVNVASGAGLVGFAGLPAYVASKHGVVGLTRASALEYAAQGIRINCVCPGSTRTPMLEGFMGGDEKVEKMMRNAVPMRRLGRPEEIAAAIVWLCSDAASFVVGHAMAVDGGSVIQ
jgi:NAD(P)-dependent dehydrogenase (short-subunit alcohol dehydrogenase family)